MAVVFGIPLGIYAGLKPTSKISKTIMAGSILGFSMPTFWVGIILIMFFSVHLGWLPSTGRGDVATYFGVTSSAFTLDGLSHIFLPAFNLALFKLSSVIRLARAGTREVILQDYIKFARAKGLAESRVVRIHLLKNIMIPVITIIGLEFGSLIAFSTVTETGFCMARNGQANHRLHLQPRSTSRCGLPHDHCGDFCYAEPNRRYSIFSS
jgi:peptide/nickel transport system permease protein